MTTTEFSPLTEDNPTTVTWATRLPWDRIGLRMLGALMLVAEMFAADEHSDED